MAVIITRPRINPDDPSETVVEATAGFLPGVDLSKCHLCGDNPPQSYWQGHHAVAVCLRCAENVLPALLADAAVGEELLPVTRERIQRSLDAFVARYWRAATLALLAADKRGKNSVRDFGLTGRRRRGDSQNGKEDTTR